MNSPALYTTIYPEVKPFIADWLESIYSQTFSSFTIWVGVDNLESECESIQKYLKQDIRWVHSHQNETPANLRRRALLRLAKEHDSVVLVDSDDKIDSDRFEAALDGLLGADLVACSMRIIDCNGNDSGCVYKVSEDSALEFPLLTHHFGFSNSAWRTKMLKRCLEAPADVPALDWILLCRAWLNGASIVGDPTVRHSYRQYGSNLARIMPPFDLESIRKATEIVNTHLQNLTTNNYLLPSDLNKQLKFRHQQVIEFECALNNPDSWFQQYSKLLSNLNKPLPWWLFVAHPELEKIWKN